LIVAACTDDDGGDEGSPTEAGSPAGENTGTVNVLSAVEPEENEVLQSIADTTINQDQSDYTVEFEQSGNFEEQVQIRSQGGTLDVILLPQPGTVVQQAQSGNAIALEDMGFDIAELESTFGEYFMSLGLVPEGRLRRGRVPDPNDVGRADGARRRDQGRRWHPVVRRLPERGLDRVAGHGLDGRHHARHRGPGDVHAVDRSRDPVQRSRGGQRR
jgi:hypothetical protein